MTTTQASELMTVKEVMVYLKLSRATIQRWCHTGALPAVKIGKEFRIRRGDLDRWYADLMAKGGAA
jgi:excisionase family DNA binding protein